MSEDEQFDRYMEREITFGREQVRLDQIKRQLVEIEDRHGLSERDVNALIKSVLIGAVLAVAGMAALIALVWFGIVLDGTFGVVAVFLYMAAVLGAACGAVFWWEEA